MIQAEIAELIDRELTKIGEELGLYADEKLLWHSVKGISNPGGNLALHVAGNLQHFIGAVLGNSGYIRQRELEFSRKDMPLNEVKEELEKARMAVRQTLASISTDELPDQRVRKGNDNRVVSATPAFSCQLPFGADKLP